VLGLRNRQDAKAVASVLRGDKAAFAGLVDRYLATVQATAYSLTGNEADAEDVAQEAFLKAYRSLDTLRETARFGPWLVTIAQNAARNFLHARKRESEVLAELQPAEAAENGVEREELRALVRRRVRQLDHDHREVLLLHYFAGHRTTEIGRLLGISRDAVKKRLQRAREALGKDLLDCAGEDLAPRLAKSPARKRIMSGILACPIVWKDGGGAQAAATGATILGGILVVKKLVAFVAAIIALALGSAWWVVLQGAPEDEQASLGAKPLQMPTPETQGRPETPDRQTPAPAPDKQAMPDDPGTELSVTQDAGVAVSGTVILPSGRLARNATVTAYTEEPECRATAETKPDGTFELAGFSPDSRLYLHAETDEFKSKRHGPIPLTNEGLHDFTIPLFALGGIRGTVVDTEDSPVPGAFVRAARPGEPVSAGPAETDARGAFELARLVPGTYHVSAEPPEGRRALGMFSESVQVSAGEMREDVRLAIDFGGDLTITGRVTDPAGAPLSGADVRIVMAATVRLTKVGGWAVRTDKDGYYTLEGLSEGEYGIWARFPGFARRGETVRAGSDDVDFVLPRVVPSPTTIAGRVLRADTDAPITKFEVCAVAAYFNDILRLEEANLLKQFQDDEGRFSVRTVQDVSGTGWTRVIARAPGFAVERAAVPPGEDPSRELVLRLDIEAVVNGMVVDEAGNPVPGACIALRNEDNSDELRNSAAAYSGSDGAFELRGLPSMPTTITANHSDYVPGKIEVFPRPGEMESARIVLSRGGTVEGTVAADGNPVADVLVTLQPPGNLFVRAGGPAVPTLETRTDSSGCYRIDAATPGAMELFVFVPESQGDKVIRPLVVENGETTQVDVDLSAHRGVLEGTVRYYELFPRSGYAYLFMPSEQGEILRTSSIEDGVFRFENLPAGAGRLEVTAFFEGYRNVVSKKNLEIVLSEEKATFVTVDFAEGGALAGRATSLRQGETGYIDVFKGALDEETLVSQPFDVLAWQGPADADGMFCATGFDPGTYTVRVSVSKEDARTLSERRASFFTVSAVIEIADKQETYVEIPVRQADSSHWRTSRQWHACVLSANEGRLDLVARSAVG